MDTKEIGGGVVVSLDGYRKVPTKITAPVAADPPPHDEKGKFVGILNKLADQLSMIDFDPRTGKYFVRSDPEDAN